MFPAKKIVMVAAMAAAVLFGSRRVQAQQVVLADSVVDCITGMIAAGNADSLATFFNKRVELSLPNFTAISSRNQAQMILRKFFTHHQPDSFAIVGENQSTDGVFVFGTLNSGDRRYRVSFLTKQQEMQQSVYQFSIEE